MLCWAGRAVGAAMGAVGPRGRRVRPPPHCHLLPAHLGRPWVAAPLPGCRGGISRRCPFRVPTPQITILRRSTRACPPSRRPATMPRQDRYRGRAGQGPRARGSVKTLQIRHGGRGARHPAPRAVPVSSRGSACVGRDSGTSLGPLASCVSPREAAIPVGGVPGLRCCVSAGPGRG